MTKKKYMKGIKEELASVRRIRSTPFSYHRVGKQVKDLIDEDWQKLWDKERSIAWNHTMLKKKLGSRPGGWKHKA